MGSAGMKGKCPESSSISSSSSSSGINHDVFLNFRGADTRKVFTDILRRDLENARIQVFQDEKSLRAGEKINQALKDAIKRSRISIAIFSKDYASSGSCLMELVQMWECSQSGGQTIIPVFYDVAPYEVKKQAGAFGMSFEKHEARENVDKNDINKWKEVLKLVGGLSGFEREKIDCGRITGLLHKVVTRVRQLLRKDDQFIDGKLVGIDLHVQEVMKKLGVVYSHGQAIKVYGEDVRVVGIWGMWGVGKTTLARLVFNKIHLLFHACCFLEGINSQEVLSSQERLIAKLQSEELRTLTSSNDGIKIISSLFDKMKVLIVLDDVHNNDQIKKLAGKVRWFGPGSRIIVTTPRKDVLKCFDFRAPEEDEGRAAEEDEGRAAEVYEVKPMGEQDALDLFYKIAFPGGAPPDDPEYVVLSREIVKALGRLPMAIVLRAEYLKQKDNIEIWRHTRDSLHYHPDEKPVLDALEASYNILGKHTKEILLDIACFFTGKDERIPSYMWEACGYNLPNGIELLRDLHLLEDGENNELRLHALTREFGRDLVKSKNIHKRCRFWNHEDVLKICEGTEKGPGIGSRVEGIGLTVDKRRFTCEEFGKMWNLRYLRLEGAKIEGDTAKLPQCLKWLDWRECDPIPKLDNMQLEKLVILDLSRSPVTKDSEFWGQIREKVKELKVLNLQGCERLHVSFDFPAPAKLEILILEGCTRLFNIGPFISELRNLTSLNLGNCNLIEELPPELYRMESLRELLIDGTGIKKIECKEGDLEKLKTLGARNCQDLQDISTIGCLRKLSSLALDGADIEGLPLSFEFPEELKRLSLRDCQKLVRLPPSIGKLELLEEMDLSDTKITELPESVQKLRNLKTLKMTRTSLEKFPNEIMKLEKLEEIDFSGCTSLEGGKSRCHISGLSSLRILRLPSTNVGGLSNSIRRCSRHLRTLDLGKCKKLHGLPKLPSSLLSLCWGSRIMEIPKLTNLTNLKVLCLIHDEQPEVGSSNQTPDIGWITGLTSLETLEVSLPNVTNLPWNLSALTQLRELTLSYMKELDLTQLPSSSSLLTLRLKHCEIQVPKFSGLQLLSELELEECDLAEINDLEKLEFLEVLKFTECNGITDLNGLKKLRRLRKVKVDNYAFEYDRATLSELRNYGCEVDPC